MHDAFVSHSSKDRQAAIAMVHYLEALGIRCWVAPRDIAPGKSYAEAILDGLSGANVMVLVLSASANTSPHVQREVERALSLGKPVIPVRVEDVKPSGALDYFISSVHWIDAFEQPVERHFQVLADHIAAIATTYKAPPEAVAPRPPVASFQAPEAAKPAPSPSRTSRKGLVGVSALILTLLASGGWWLSRKPPSPPAAPVAQAVAPTQETESLPDGDSALRSALAPLVERLRDFETKVKFEADTVSEIVAPFAGMTTIPAQDASEIGKEVDAAVTRTTEHRMEAEKTLAQIEVLAATSSDESVKKLVGEAGSLRDLIVERLSDMQAQRAGMPSASSVAAQQGLAQDLPGEVAPATQAQSPPAENVTFTNSIGMRMVWVAGISGWVDAHELSQAAYEEVTSVNPSSHRGSGSRPVDSVSWVDANRFCEKLTEMESRSGNLPAGFVYRLPGDQEWTVFSEGTTRDMAVFSSSRANKRSSSVSSGTLPPNPAGLYDVLGNIYEWCHDDFDRTMNSGIHSGAMSDLAPNGKVVRGGSFQSYSKSTQSLDFRASDRPGERHHTVGFRVVLGKPLQ